jgi:hypothetical protein
MSPSTLHSYVSSHIKTARHAKGFFFFQFAELIKRGGWSQRDLAGLAGENVLRVLEGAEKTAAKMKKEGAGPSMAIYDKRTDIKRNGTHHGDL